MGLKTIVEDEIFEESSWDLSFDLYAADGTTPVTPSSKKFYLYVKDTEDSPTYINGRDGTDNTGLTNSENSIALHLSPDDNQIVGSDDYADLPYEDHVVLIELKYNSDTDKDFFEWHLRVKNLQPVI